MSKLTLIGVGRIGKLTLKLLANDIKGLDIVAVDCRDLSRDIYKYGPNIVFRRCCKPSDILEYAKGSDLLAIALPSEIAYNVLHEAIKHGFDVVDVSYIDFDPYIFDDIIHRDSFYVPNAGFSPGLTNLVAGYVFKSLGELNKLAIYVGGIPVEPVPPVNYQITWSPEDLIEMYTRRARIILDGKLVEVEPLDKIFDVEIPGIGRFEGFYSDGLGTLTRNIKASFLYEVTLRHPGHLNAMKLLHQLGFFSRDAIYVPRCMVKPYKLTAKLFEKYLRQTIPDQAILFIEAYKDGCYYRFKSHLKGGEDYSATALYTALIFTKTIELALKGRIEPGIHPLEDLYSLYGEYIDYLMKNEVYIEIDTNCIEPYR